MELRPEPRKFRKAVSVIIIEILAAVVLCVSLIMLLGGILSKSTFLGTSGVITGITGIILSALLTIIAAVADDNRYQSYLQECQFEEDKWYHTQMLQSVSWMLQQTYNSQQPPYVPDPYQQDSAYEQPQQTWQPEPPAPDFQPQEEARQP